MKIAPQMASSPFLIYIILGALFVVSSNALSEHESNKPIKFAYTGDKGPNKWGSLSNEFETCSNGKQQSPIDIVTKDLVANTSLTPLRGEYENAYATLANHGFNVGIRFENSTGNMTIDGITYTLKQIHWHTPSEHRIDGYQYAAELHMVHIAEDGAHAVVAVLYKYGPADPLIEKIKGKLVELSKEKGNHDARITIGTMNTRQLKKTSRKYYRYVGSLTTPPCTENVVWHVLGKLKTISKAQVDLLKAQMAAGFKYNARPVQPINERKVEIYERNDN